MKRRMIFTFAMAVLAVCMIQFAPSSFAAEKSERTVNVNLSADEDAAMSNFITLRNALRTADSDSILKIVLPKGGRYLVDTTGSALVVRSNTTIDLNGSTLVRSGTMLNQNMFQNADFNGEQTTGGYSLSHDITIQNGIVDGAGDKADSGVNLINIGHANGIVISNLKVLNVLDGHLIEFSGCKNVTVKNCTFDGFYGDTASDNEAIQLDISKKGWNTKYLSDSTVCQNVTVQSCTFNNVPTGVGNHHTFTDGYHNKNIKIIGNKFNNRQKFDTLGPAVYCVGFDNSVVKDNTINGYYCDGVKILCGSVEVSGNTINTKSVKNSSGIYMTVSSSYIHNSDDEPATERSKEYVTGGKVYGNTISGYANHGITVSTNTVIEYIRNNTITGGKGNGINISDSTVKKDINNNSVKNCKYYDANNIGSGIRVTSNSLVPEVKGNTVTDCEGYGIEHYSKKCEVCVTKNTLTNNKKGEKNVAGVGLISPSSVTGLKAANIKHDRVKLTWNKERSASGYIVCKYDENKKAYVTASKIKSNTAYVTLTDLKAGTSYKFAVKAYSAANGSEEKSPSYAKITVVTALPKVTGLKAQTTSSSVKLSWSKVSGAQGYIIYQYNEAKKAWNKVSTVKSLSGTVTKLKAATSYKFAVKAYKTVSKKEVLSENFSQVEVSTTPGKVAFKLTTSAGKVTAKWSKVSGATGYKVYYKTSADGAWKLLATTTSTSYSKSGLTKGKAYYFTVSAYKTLNKKDYIGTSDAKSITVK